MFSCIQRPKQKNINGHLIVQKRTQVFVYIPPPLYFDIYNDFAHVFTISTDPVPCQRQTNAQN